MNIFEIIKKGALKFWKNPVLGIPNLLNTLLTYIPTLIFILIIASLTGVPAMSLLTNPDALTAESLADHLTVLVVLIIAVFIVWALISAFFEGILINMLNSNKIRFSFEGKRFFGRIFGFEMLFAAYIIICFGIIALLSILFAAISLWLLLIPLILTIMLFISLLFPSLAAYYIVIKDCGINEAIKLSCMTVGKKYFKLLGLGVILGIIAMPLSMLFGLIPVVGTAIISILLVTFIRICLYIFVIDSRK